MIKVKLDPENKNDADSIMLTGFMPLVILVLLGTVLVANAGIPLPSDRETRSTRAIGTLLCGKRPLKDAVVRLYRGKSEDISDSIAEATTDASGKFKVQGNTGNFAADKSNLDPYLKIYHKCDDADGTNGYRRLTIRYPRAYVNSGTLAFQTYDVGTLNLQLEFPEEKRENSIVGYTKSQLN